MIRNIYGNYKMYKERKKKLRRAERTPPSMPH